MVAAAKGAAEARAAGEGVSMEESVDSHIAEVSERAKMAEAKKHADFLARLFTPLHRRMTFPTFDPDSDHDHAVKEAAHKWASAYKAGGEAPSQGLMLSGSTGRGKTHLGIATLQAVASPDVRVEICAVPTFLARIRARFSNSVHGDPEEILERCQKADVLLIDDLGAERETEWAAETLFLLTDYRVNYELPTLVTTNLSPVEFNARAGGNFPEVYGKDPIHCQRIYSRLRGQVEGNIYTLDGRDRRVGN
jgi:DNA replication protein DnaC